jgi:hypothetical protein
MKLGRGRNRKGREGQISILVGTMMLTFLLFFAFVINVGMLVNAKINLQNAADMAAYAGAAVQARQLNAISYLNYEMRRAYKKFIFRYYVIGNMAQMSHPPQPQPGPRQWMPNGKIGQSRGQKNSRGEDIVDYQVPTTCITVSTTDNYCQVHRVKKITIPSASSNDAINSSLTLQLKALEQIRQGGCKAIGSTNTQMMYYWLYNTDPPLTDVKNQLASVGTGAADAVVKRLQALQGLANGMGLVPRELILKSRIDTLSYYVNFPPQRNMTREGIDSFIKRGDAAARERTYSAFFSAFNSLGEHTFDDIESITMDEVVPERVDTVNGKPVNLLKLETIQTAFDVYVSQMGYKDCSLENIDKPPSGGDPADCVQCLLAIPVNINVPVGVYKDPSILTYYAVRLNAAAKVMFNPFGGDLKLRAYAAAQPFGSRIGPKLTGSDFIRTRNAKYVDFCEDNNRPPGVECVGAVPNLPILENDGSELGMGWDTNLAVGGFFSAFAGTQNVNTLSAIGVKELQRAYHAAQAPNPWELGKYNIPVNDTPRPVGNVTTLPDQFTQNFDERGLMALWAPIRSADENGGQFDKTEIESLLKSMTKNTTGSVQKAIPDDLKDALIKGFERYLDALRKGQGEDGEAFNVAHIIDPVNTRLDDPQGRQELKLQGAAMSLIVNASVGNALKIKSSYNPKRAKDLVKDGRAGYSVKFVPVRVVAGQGSYVPTGAGNSFRNPIPSSELEDELDRIQH